MILMGEPLSNCVKSLDCRFDLACEAKTKTFFWCMICYFWKKKFLSRLWQFMHQSEALVEMVKDMLFLKNIYSIIRPKNVKKQVKMPKNRLFEIEKLATSLFFHGNPKKLVPRWSDNNSSFDSFNVLWVSHLLCRINLNLLFLVIKRLFLLNIGIRLWMI